MTRRSYPDATFVADEDNAYYYSPRLRRFLTFYKVFKYLIGGIISLIALLILVVAGVMLGFNGVVWIALCLGLFAFLGWMLSFFHLLKRVPLRCSRCSGFMQRETKNCSADFAVVFYICPPCKRYIDSGHAEGVS
jgi:hypothetical protein